MLDETIICETPPLYSCYGRIGQQVRVPITGHHDKRILHGVLNVWSGDTLLLISEELVQEVHQYFLSLIRSHWRGWHIVLFQDRHSAHTSDESWEWASDLEIEIRLLPKATPELNAMDQLWRRAKGETLASRATQSIEHSTDSVCQYILDLSPRDRLRKAGVLSGDSWLTK
jgi:transposase